MRPLPPRNIQGKEFVRTLTRKNRPAIESVNPTIGNPYAKYTRQYRDDFCALIMGRRGEKGADSFGSCRAALEKEPHDRSMIVIPYSTILSPSSVFLALPPFIPSVPVV